VVLVRDCGEGQVDQRVEHFHHAEVVHARAEEHRRLLAGQEGLAVPGGGGAGGQFHAFHGVLEVGAEALDERVAFAQRDGLEVVRQPLAARLEHRHRLRAQVHDAAEALALAHGPGHGHAGHAELALHLVQDVQRLAHFTVHLVDEGDDGRVALAADLDQPARLRFHAVGRVDHHQRRVDGGEHAVGVFREVLVAGRVEQVDHVLAVQHLHDRRGHRDAALLFDFHPVGGGVARGLARLDRAGDLDRAGEQQQLFSQRGLAGVRMGNDREGAAAAGFGKEGG